MGIIIKTVKGSELAVKGHAQYADECLDQDSALRKPRWSSYQGPPRSLRQQSDLFVGYVNMISLNYASFAQRKAEK